MPRTPPPPLPRRALIGELLSGLAVIPGQGWPHAQLVRSLPARRAVAPTAPPRVRLWFNERLEPAFARVSVWDERGTQVDLKDAGVGSDDPKELSAGLLELEPGTYTVRYRVLSVDGHVLEGEFPFTIRRRQ